MKRINYKNRPATAPTNETWGSALLEIVAIPWAVFKFIGRHPLGVVRGVVSVAVLYVVIATGVRASNMWASYSADNSPVAHEQALGIVGVTKALKGAVNRIHTAEADINSPIATASPARLEGDVFMKYPSKGDIFQRAN